MTRAILHVDMDAFYASVEQRDDPSLRGRPVIVGGHPTRGVVLAASYEVRPFGVRSAMPMQRALKLAPQAVVVAPRPRAYEDASAGIHAVFERYTPLIEPLSLDEAFLDVTASHALFGSGREIAERIRREIRAETGLVASAGVAPVKFAAKIASDLAKPNGLLEVPAHDVAGFLAPLPVSRLWGVGPKLEERLLGLGMRTIGQVAARDGAWLSSRLGEAGTSLHALANGRDPREVIPDREAKSIGAEDTFEEDLRGVDALLPHLHGHALRVARRLRRAGLKARVVVLKLKTSDFQLLTRRRTLAAPTDDGQALYREVAELLRESHGDRSYRLTGVSAQDLAAGPGAQLGLFQDAAQVRRDKLNQALDQITARYGKSAVSTADLPKASPSAPGSLRGSGGRFGDD